MLHAQAFVVPARQKASGLLNNVVDMPGGATMSPRSPRKDGEQVEGHRGEQGLNPGRALLGQRMAALGNPVTIPGENRPARWAAQDRADERLELDQMPGPNTRSIVRPNPSWDRVHNDARCPGTES